MLEETEGGNQEWTI